MTGLSVAIFLDPYRSLKIAIFHSDCRYVTFTSVEDYMYLMNHGSKAVHNNHHMALNFTLYLREAFFVGDVYFEPSSITRPMQGKDFVSPFKHDLRVYIPLDVGYNGPLPQEAQQY